MFQGALGERGAAAVEFALVLLPLTLLLLGIVDVSRLYNSRIALSEAAAEGARALVASRPMTSAEVAASLTRARAVIRASLRGSTVRVGELQMRPCPVPSSSNAGELQSAEAVVELETTVELMVPLPPAIAPDVTLTGTGVRQCVG